MPLIPKYVHRCIIQSGNLAGNDYTEDVSGYDIEFKNSCNNCGELLATQQEILAHIYGHLTEEPS